MLTTRSPLRYKQHIIRQAHDIALFMRDENLVIDDSIDYDVLPGMSHEVRQRLKDARPTTLVSPFLRPEAQAFISRDLTLADSFTGPSEASRRRYAGVTRLLDAVRAQWRREEGDGTRFFGPGPPDDRAREPSRGDVVPLPASQLSYTTTKTSGNMRDTPENGTFARGQKF